MHHFIAMFYFIVAYTVVNSTDRSIERVDCREISVATYGTEWPLVGMAGGRRVAQRAD